MELVDSLIKEEWLKTPRIIKAFKEIKRKDFLPKEIKNLAELNEALSIGFGQTISQPLVVAFMLELLQPKTGDKILDIGSGSGWTSGLLAHIVSQKSAKGKVFAVEIIPELKEFGQRNTEKYSFVKKGIAEFFLADASEGFAKAAPFDKILCSASAKEIASCWKKQLKIGGRTVSSVNNDIIILDKIKENKFKEKRYEGFAFVPLVTHK